LARHVKPLMASGPDRRRARPPKGFTYLGLMFLISLLGLMAAAAAATWSFTGQRDKERELLFVGRAYRAALGRYAAAHAGQSQPYPTDLSQLIGAADPLRPQHFLRQRYVDPITGSSEWGLVRTPQGGIVGVYSLSTQAPVRRRGVYGDEGIAFAGAKTYRDWVFQAGAAGGRPGVVDDSLPRSTPGAVPGWNYDRDGEPPATWGKAGGPPQAADEP